MENMIGVVSFLDATFDGKSKKKANDMVCDEEKNSSLYCKRKLNK